MPLASICSYLTLIKFSHSIFAAPFALAMAVIVARTHPVSWSQLLWIVIALVAARSAAMGWNRILDADVDAANPRTAQREIPAGVVSKSAAWSFSMVSAGIFLGASYALGVHCFYLAPLVLAVLFLYSWTKRFTPYSHIVLGLCLAMAPGGVWYALTAQFAWFPVVLMGAVLFWVAGFDILYSCQDLEFDRKRGLFSIPAWVGAERAFNISRLLHLAAFALLAWFTVLADGGGWMWIGVAFFGGALISQHRLVQPHDLSNLNAAFFTRNGVASAVFFLATLLDHLYPLRWPA